MKELRNKTQNTEQYANIYYPEPYLLPRLLLEYPGRLDKKGDYRLKYNNCIIKHTDIVCAIYEFVKQGGNNGLVITNFIVNLYKYGLNANTNTTCNKIKFKSEYLSLNELKHLLYWLVLQEDINYPRPQRMGVRMPLIRYIESAMSALHPNLLPIEEVLKRTNNHGSRPPNPFIKNGIEDYLINNIKSIS